MNHTKKITLVFGGLALLVLVWGLWSVLNDKKQVSPPAPQTAEDRLTMLRALGDSPEKTTSKERLEMLNEIKAGVVGEEVTSEERLQMLYNLNK